MITVPKRWLAERLKEPTTWLGIIATLVASGIQISPEWQTHLVQLGCWIGGAILIWMREN